MSCDIYMAVETKAHDRWWPAAEGFNLTRNYRLFGHLVRGHSRYPGVDEAVEERGMPDELFPDSRRDLGDHTFSWLTPAEYLTALERYRRREGVAVDESYQALMAYVQTLAEAKGPGNVRLVFGFDS